MSDDAFPPLRAKSSVPPAARASGNSGVVAAAAALSPAAMQSRCLSEPVPSSSTATPTASTVVAVKDLQKYCGARVIVKVGGSGGSGGGDAAAEREFRGRLIGCDSSMVCVVQEAGVHRDQIVIHHVHEIAGVRVLPASMKSWTPAELLSLGVLENADAMRRRRDQAIASRRHEASRIGVGVTPFAQALFDRLSKTMQCQWKDTHILVYDVLIRPPYTADSCTSANPSSLARVQKMLSAERVKVEADVQRASSQ